MTTITQQTEKNITTEPADFKTKKTLITPPIAPPPATAPIPSYTDYYSDTISSADSDKPTVYNVTSTASAKMQTSGEIIEMRLAALSDELDQHLDKDDRDFELLLRTVNKIIMLQMRKAVQADQDFIYEMTVQNHKKALTIKGTYNSWTGTTITIISAVISIGGGLAGFAHFVPGSILNPDVARAIAGNAQQIGTAGTGLSGIAQIFNSRQEAIREVERNNHKRIQDKEDDRKGAKNTHKEGIKTAKTAQDEFKRMRDDIVRAMTS